MGARLGAPEVGNCSKRPMPVLREQMQLFSGLKTDCLTWCDGDLGSGARIASDAGFAGLDGEDAKATEFDAVAGDEGTASCCQISRQPQTLPWFGAARCVLLPAV